MFIMFTIKLIGLEWFVKRYPRSHVPKISGGAHTIQMSLGLWDEIGSAFPEGHDDEGRKKAISHKTCKEKEIKVMS